MTNNIHRSTSEEHELYNAKCCACCKHAYTSGSYLKCELRTCGVPFADNVYDIIVQPYNVCKEWTK